MSLYELIVQTGSAFLAILGFGIILSVPHGLLAAAGFAGALNWAVYCVVTGAGGGVVRAALMASMAAAFSSHVLARRKKAPVMVFLLPGILPTVPGASIYRTVLCLSRQENILAADYLAETLQIAGAMALGIFIVDSVVRQLPWGTVIRHPSLRK